MMLVFNDPKNPNKKIEVSLTVPPEAVRGLYCGTTGWILYVTDPATMPVAWFRLRPETLREAALEIHRDIPERAIPPLGPRDGAELLNWILAQRILLVEPVDPDGPPAMVPSFPGCGPKPKGGLGSPKAQ